MDDRIYIAAPFFNSAQEHLVAEIEDMLLRENLNFFSPRLSQASKDAFDHSMTPERAEKIFERNIDELESCRYIIVVMDWYLPDHLQVVLQDMKNPENIDRLLNIPDAGTVWELGYVSAFQDPPLRIGLRSVHEQPINLMLSISCDVIMGMEDLEVFLQSIGRKRKINHV